jgi:hypothetical protein
MRAVRRHRFALPPGVELPAAANLTPRQVVLAAGEELGKSIVRHAFGCQARPGEG